MESNLIFNLICMDGACILSNNISHIEWFHTLIFSTDTLMESYLIFNLVYLDRACILRSGEQQCLSHGTSQILLASLVFLMISHSYLFYRYSNRIQSDFQPSLLEWLSHWDLVCCGCHRYLPEAWRYNRRIIWMERYCVLHLTIE